MSLCGKEIPGGNSQGDECGRGNPAADRTVLRPEKCRRIIPAERNAETEQTEKTAAAGILFPTTAVFIFSCAAYSEDCCKVNGR